MRVKATNGFYPPVAASLGSEFSSRFNGLKVLVSCHEEEVSIPEASKVEADLNLAEITLPRICAIPVTPQQSGRHASVTQTISYSLSAPPVVANGDRRAENLRCCQWVDTVSGFWAVLRLQAEHTHISSRSTCSTPMHEQVRRICMVTHAVLTMPVIRKSATTRPQMCFRCRPEGGNLRVSWLPGDEAKIHCLGVWLHGITAKRI